MTSKQEPVVRKRLRVFGDGPKPDITDYTRSGYRETFDTAFIQVVDTGNGYHLEWDMGSVDLDYGTAADLFIALKWQEKMAFDRGSKGLVGKGHWSVTTRKGESHDTTATRSGKDKPSKRKDKPGNRKA